MTDNAQAIENSLLVEPRKLFGTAMLSREESATHALPQWVLRRVVTRSPHHLRYLRSAERGARKSDPGIGSLA